MKRYWILIMLIPFAVISLSMYYAAASEEDKTPYYIKTLAGREEEAAHVTITGKHLSEPVSVGLTGSEYPYEEQSLFQRLDSDYFYIKDLQELAVEYRSFMRGNKDINAFYVDEQQIVYVDSDREYDSGESQSDTLEISQLDRKRKSTSTFQIKVDKASNEYMQIADVQVKDRTMKLLVYHFRQSGKYASQLDPDYRMYTIDLENKLLEGKLSIAAGAPNNTEKPTVFTRLWSDTMMEPSRYVVFDRTLFSSNETQDDSQTNEKRKVEHRELMYYDVWNGLMTTVQSDPILETLKGPGEWVIRHSGDDVYLTPMNIADQSRILHYNLAEKKLVSDTKIELQADQEEWRHVQTQKLVGNRLYMNWMGSRKPGIAVVDLETGKMLYQGTIERKDQLDLNSFMMDGLSVK